MARPSLSETCTPSHHAGLSRHTRTLGFTCCRKPQRRRSEGWRQSGASPGWALVLVWGFALDAPSRWPPAPTPNARCGIELPGPGATPGPAHGGDDRRRQPWDATREQAGGALRPRRACPGARGTSGQRSRRPRGLACLTRCLPASWRHARLAEAGSTLWRRLRPWWWGSHAARDALPGGKETLGRGSGLLGFSPAPWAPNAGAHLLPEAEARYERRLEAVRCSAVLGRVTAELSTARPRC